MNENTELEKRYFDETARVLRREGFQVEQAQGGQLTVILNDRPVCEVCKIGGIEYSGITTPELLAAKDKVYGVVSTTAEYMRQMEQAPSLTVSGVKDGCKVLADFNGTILAGAYGKDSLEFTTWDCGLDRDGVYDEHFFGGNYKSAKQDFAMRSGLIPDGALFTPKQLTEVYRSIQDTFDHAGQMSEQRQRVLEKLQSHIRENVPDLRERVKLCNERDQQRSVLFFVVTVTAGDEDTTFLVGGIPREYDDLPGHAVYAHAEEIVSMGICYNQLAENLHDYQAEDLAPLLELEKPLEDLCHRWMVERNYDPSEDFDRVFRNPSYLEEPEPGPSMG